MILAGVLIAITIILWSSAFVAIGLLVETMHPVTLAAFRFLVASICLLPVAMRSWRVSHTTKASPMGKTTLALSLAGAGITGIFGYNILLNSGQMQVDPATASLIVNVVPVLTYLFCCLLGLDRFVPVKLAALAVCLGGVALVIVSPLEGVPGWSFSGLLIFGAAICQALYFIFVRSLLDSLSPEIVTVIAVWLGTMVLVPFAISDMWQHQLTTNEILLLLYLGIGPTAIGFLCWSIVLRHITASAASSFLFLVPLSSLLITWGLLDRLPPAISFVGGCTILTGLWLFHIRKRN